jgi:hypothetical protein
VSSSREVGCRGGIDRAPIGDRKGPADFLDDPRLGAGLPVPGTTGTSTPTAGVSTVDRFGDHLYP